MSDIKSVEPFQVGAHGYSRKQTINSIRNIQYKFDAASGQLTIAAPASAVFVFNKPIKITDDSKLVGMDFQHVTFKYDGDVQYMLLCISCASSCDVWAQVIDLTVTANKPVPVGANNLVQSFLNSTNVVSRRMPSWSSLFARTNKQTMSGDGVVGYLPEQHLHDAVEASTLAGVFAPIILASHDSWGAETEDFGLVLLSMMNFCGCGSLHYTAGPAIKELVSCYSIVDEHVSRRFDYSKLPQLQEKYGIVSTDLLFAILDELELIEHGSSVPGWLNEFGVFVFDVLTKGNKPWDDINEYIPRI